MNLNVSEFAEIARDITMRCMSRGWRVVITRATKFFDLKTYNFDFIIYIFWLYIDL